MNVGGNVNKSIPGTRKPPIFNRIPNSIFLAPVTEGEIEIIIESFNQKKAIGPYSIPVFLLKILSRYIAEPLSKIVNQSFHIVNSFRAISHVALPMVFIFPS